MGIFDALNTAVGGLQAQSFALQNISGNIANASTTGYKGIDTTFEDLIPDATSPSRQVAGGVTAFAQATITTQGTVSTTTVATNMAINGDGFFSVQASTGTTDNVPNFSGVTDYTRRGDFQVNSNGNLVNGAGYYLMGVAVDPTTAVSSTSAAGTIDAVGGLNAYDFVTPPLTYSDVTKTGTVVNNHLTTPAPITGATKLSGIANTDSLVPGFSAGSVGPPAVAADTITVNGTTITFVAGGATGNELNVTDTVSDLLAKIDSLSGGSGSTVVTSGALTGAISLHTGYQQDLSITSSSAGFAALGLGASPLSVARGTAGAGTVSANDQQTFLNESISGGAVTAYDQTGTAVNLQLRWAKTDSAALGGTHTNTWNLFYQSNPGATGTAVAWTNVGTNFTFGPAGALVSPATPAITIPSVAVGNQVLGNLSFSMGAGSLTQYASTGGTATINAVTQNGYAAGQLQSVAINNNGIVVGAFSNGQNLDLASVTLSHFNGTNYLKALDGGAYAVTEGSGPAIIGASGTIAGSSLEGSNTDIASEFTKLIVTQQAYSANTKVITTANSMVQDLLNVLR